MPFVYTPRKTRRSFTASAPQPSAPSGGGGGSTPRYGFTDALLPRAAATAFSASRDRGAPERLEVDVMGLVQKGAMAPAHTLERPLAVANTAARFITGTPQVEKGPLDHLLQGIGDLGIGEANIGNLVGAIGKGIMHIGNAPMAAINATDAQVLARVGGFSDSTLLKDAVTDIVRSEGGPLYLAQAAARTVDGPPILGMLGIGGRPMTVGEFKAELADRGFNQEYDEETGTTTELSWDEVVGKAQSDPLGFGDKAINDSIFVDLGARVALDPFNVILGAGLVGKAGKLVNWATRSRFSQVSAAAGSRIRSAYGVGYLKDMASTGVRLAEKPAAALSARAITAGRMEAATLRGLGMVLAAPRTLLLPGTGTVGRRYARGALRLEAGLLGAEGATSIVSGGATSVLGEDNVISGFMEPIHDLSQALLADKPMSEDIAFMLVSAFAMPAVPLIKEDVGALRSRSRETFGDQDLFLWGREFGADTSGLKGRQDPLGRRRGKAREAELVSRLGGQPEFARLIDHIDMRIAFDRMKAYTPIVKHFESFDEAMARSRAIGHVIATEARRLRAAGEIKPKARLEAFQQWGRAHSRTLVDRKGNLIKDVAQRVDFELSPKALIDQWLVYREVHSELSSRFQPVGEAILGRAQRLTVEDLNVVKSAVASATKNGRVNAEYVRDLLSQTPAMFEDHLLSPEQREYWIGLMNLGVGAADNGQGSRGTFDSAELQAQLDVLSKNAPPARELYHEAAASERKAATGTRSGGGPVASGRVRRIYSTKKLRDLRVNANGEIRRLTKEIDAGAQAMERKWTSRGNLRLRRAKPVRATKPEKSPMPSNPELQGLARTYNETRGLPTIRQGEYWELDSDFARRTGLAYEAMDTVGNDRATALAYERFEAETLEQYEMLTEAGYVMEPWTKDGQPYATSAEMQADVRKNKHLYFFTGGEAHPFLGTALKQYGGLTANDIFRAVHDIITHATEGYQFGARGEVNAAIKHSQMFTPIARRAMLSETHGQNSWVNYGPHNPQKLAAPDRPYATQKSALLPDEIIFEFESRYLGETHAVASRKARDAAEALGLTGDQANAAAAILEARARAWASNNPGKTSADYLRRFEFESGGEPGLEALFQKYNQGLANYRPRTAGTAFPKPPPLREGSKLSNRLARKAAAAAKRRDGILPAPDTAAGREMARRLLPDTPEIKWLEEVARGETLSKEGSGPYYAELEEIQDTFYRAVYREQQRQIRNGGELTDDVLFQSPDELVEMIDEPVPAVLEENDLGGASALEVIEGTDGQPFALPGGAAGLADDSTFTLWDLWKIRSQAFDPANFAPEVATALYAKMFRTQVRSLQEDSLDALNRMAFAMLSPNANLAANETLYSLIRMRNLADVEELAAVVDEVEARGPTGDATLASEIGFELQRRIGLTGEGALKGPKTVSTNTQLGNLAITAKRYLEQPDFFLLRDGESLIEYVERLSAVTPGAAFKVSNFGVMLGDPIAAPVGTMDSHMAQLVGAGNSAPKSRKIAYRTRAGEINPAVPPHLRDLPWEPREVTIYGGDYAKAHDALEAMARADGGTEQFGMGGYQWLRWDQKRGHIEPHPLVFPGAYRLPKMDPSARQGAYNELGRAGFTDDRAQALSSFPPSQAFLYQKTKGSTEFLDDGTAVIRGLNAPDISTFIHEVGHVFRRDLVDEDLALAETHYKVLDGVWAREAEEAFAKDFERWTRTGKNAPAGLEIVFAKLYEWMRQVYRTVLRKDVDGKMGAVFTRLFEGPQAPAEIPGFVEGFARIRGNMDAAERATGAANTIATIKDQVIGETRMVTLAKFGDDGKAVAHMNIVFDPDTGLAAKDGLYITTVRESRNQGHATELYAFAEQQGWEIEQASARSENLTEAGRAFQVSRWAKQRAADGAELDAKRVLVRERRSEVREINARAAEITTTRIDPSFLDESGNPTVTPESLEALREQTAFVQDTFPRQYGIEKAPKVSYARYEPDDSHLAALLTERSNLAQVLFDYGPIAKMTQFIEHATSPVKASAMAHDGRQQVFNLLLPLKGKTKEVSDFLDALRNEQNKGYTTGKLHQPFFRGVTSLPPNRITTIAREAFGSNEAFLKAFEEKYGGIDRMHVMLDEAHNSLVRRIDKQVMRGQKIGALGRIFRSGYWAWQHLPGVRTASDVTRMVSKVYYPLFRFQMDLRWQALNIVEADTLAFFRDGVDGTRFSSARDQVVRRGGRDVNITQNAVDFHGQQSGMPQAGKKGIGSEAAYEDTGIFLTNQNLAPVLKRSFQKQSLENVDDVLNDYAANTPIGQLLRRKYGEEKGTWADQINETLYSFDRRGVRKTIDEAVRKVRKYEKWSQAEYDQMVPFINKLIERNQKTFDDLTQIHIGNINRSRLERTLNSFWLYWPMSYQIKATKWMVGLLTQRSFGQQTNLGGAFTLDRAAERVREMVRSNPEFQQQMEDNEDWWFAASMLLPVAPWDYGMSLNRHVRYVGGNVLGLWPEYAGLEDAGDYAQKTLEMGPVYTIDLIDRFFTERAPEGPPGPTPTSLAP